MWSWMRFSFFPEAISRIGVLLGENQIPMKCKPIEELCVSGAGFYELDLHIRPQRIRLQKHAAVISGNSH